MPTHKVARDARTGQFISLCDAQRRPATSVVETIHVSRNGVRRLKRRRSARRLDDGQGRGLKAGRDL